MPGPKIPRPSSDNAASTIAMASSMLGWSPAKPAVNSAKRVEPIPMMTARTLHPTVLRLRPTAARDRSAIAMLQGLAAFLESAGED